MGKRIKLVLIFQLIFLVIIGQNKLYFEVSGTMPFIPELKKTPNYFELPFPGTGGTIIINNYSRVEKYIFKPGVSLNFGVQRKIMERTDINLGLGFSFYHYGRATYVDLNNYRINSSRGVITNKSIVDNMDASPYYGQSYLYYFTVPLNLKYEIIIDKFAIDAGIVNSILTYSSQQIQYVFYDGTIYEEIYSGYGLSNYLLGINVSLQYKVFGGLWLSASYKHKTTPIYIEAERFGGDAKFKLIDFGLRYYL